MKTTVLARIAAVAVAAVVLAACSAINPITTQDKYQSSDGATVPIGDTARGINLLVVTTAVGEPAVLTGSIRNDAAEDLDLFALRALSRQPMHRLARISDDPAGAWRRRDPAVVRRLAELELRTVGLKPPPA